MEKIVYLERQDADEVALESLSEEERIDQAVKWINRKVANTVHFGLIQIGYFLLNTFFGGSIEEALSKNPHKTQSFRRLCRRTDLVISASHLTNAVKLVVQEKTLAGDRAFAALPVSHKIALLPVENLELKRMLAEKTLDEGLSVRALSKEIKDAKKRGLPQQAWSRRFRRALDTVKREIDSPEAQDLRELGFREAQALKLSVEEARERLELVLSSLPEKQAQAQAS
jgi:hypothetical protein